MTKKLKYLLFVHIREYASTQNIHIDFMNGYTDHIHCLISLNCEQSIAKVINLIKGESSFWINKNKLTDEKFEWQKEYFAVSVSEIKIKCSARIYKKPRGASQNKNFSGRT
ncbi:MAG TPA: transposase [Puia sp.]|nr:transposase [Puia sp.]